MASSVGRKRLRSSASLGLWGLVAAVRALGAGLRWVVVVVIRSITAVVLARRARVVLAEGALLVVVAGLVAEPALRLVAGPAARTLGSRGLQPLEQRSTVVAADGGRMAVLHDGVNRRVVPLERVPEVMRRAVVAAEDRRFWRHGGYDLEAVVRATLANLQAREVTQGASTLTQQLAKANFVGNEPTATRKAKELVYAVALEGRFTKAELLERYLNQVYFGSGAYGVAAAAEEYFGVEVEGLTLEQAALLAGLIRAPVAADPRRDPEAARLRRNQVLAAMDAPRPAAEAPVVVLPARPPEPADPYVIEAVKREFLANPAFGPSEEDRRRLLLTGGVEIHTTIDPDAQAAAREATDYVPGRLGSALVAIDPRSGRIRALHDGGAAGLRHFDVATLGRREPGSTFKPLAAVAALEEGMPVWQSLVGDGPVELSYRGDKAPWVVRNFRDGRYGLVDLHEAVVNSVNTAFAQLGVALGPDRIAEVAGRLGIDVEDALGPPSARGPSVAIGALAHGVSPLELASAYGAFAAGGTHVTPHLIERVVGPDGRELHRAEPAPRRVVDPAVNAEVVEMLRDAVSEGTGTAASLPGWRPLGKTGTSEASADAWFVGAVPGLVAAVWVGDPETARPVPGLTGGAHAAPVWRRFMAAALDGQSPAAFPGPGRSRDPSRLRPLRLPVARPCAANCSDVA